MTPQIAIITEAQADELRGQWYLPDSYFAPTFLNNEWFISSEEVEQNINPAFPWVNTLPLSNYPP